MSHQDWTHVVFKKPVKQTTTIVPKTSSPQSGTKTNENDEVVSIKKVTVKMSQLVVQARITKKLTQVQLANACCLDSKIINEIERGGCVYNADQINKISKILNIKIPRD